MNTHRHRRHSTEFMLRIVQAYLNGEGSIEGIIRQDGDLRVRGGCVFPYGLRQGSTSNRLAPLTMCHFPSSFMLLP
jgi:hypothetical protein